MDNIIKRSSVDDVIPCIPIDREGHAAIGKLQRLHAIERYAAAAKFPAAHRDAAIAIDGDSVIGLGLGQGNRIGPRPTDHCGIGRVHHDGVVTVAAIQNASAGAAHNDVAVARTDCILHRNIGAAVAARAVQQVDGDASRGSGIGDRIVAATADHRGIGCIHHDGVVAITAIQNAGAGAAHDDVAMARTDCILHGNIGTAVAARSGRQVDSHAGRSPGIGDRIVAATADHRGIGCVDHDGVVAVAAIQHAGAGATYDDVAVARANRASDRHISAAVAA